MSARMGMQTLWGRKMTRNNRLTSRGIYTIRALCREDWPITSLTETGQRIGVTRERVRQLVRQYGIPTLLKGERGLGKCSWCQRKYHGKMGFCLSCLSWSARTILVCDECGAYFSRRTCELNWRMQKDGRYRGKHYCSRRCSGLNTLSNTPNWQKALCSASDSKRHTWVCRDCGAER